MPLPGASALRCVTTGPARTWTTKSHGLRRVTQPASPAAVAAGGPGCRRRGELRGRSCRPVTVPLTGRGPALWPAGRAGHGSRARWPGMARRSGGGRAAWPEQGPGQRDPGRFSSGARYRPAIGRPGTRSRARPAWLARFIHWPTAVNRSFPAAVNAQMAIATRQASGLIRPCRERGSGSASSRCRDRTRPRARPCATVPLRACYTSFVETSETYMIRWRARVHRGARALLGPLPHL